MQEVTSTVSAPQGRDSDRPAFPVRARLSHPVAHPHDVLGGIPAFGELDVRAVSCGACRHGFEGAAIALPAGLVFEDVAPHLWDVTGDGIPEVVVVESTATKGGRLTVWSYENKALTRIAATPFIGTPRRWLAPVGAGDFDGDGRIEIAYVDRPHLEKALVFVQIRGSRLREVGRIKGLTNHGIGEKSLQSGTRNCGQGDEVVLQSADRRRLIAATLTKTTDLGPFSAAALAKALACR